jgi:hypothetical protein
MTLAYLGALVTPTNEFNAYAERLELGALARAMLLGVLNATLTPWPWPGLGESFRKAYGDPVTLAKLMRGTLPDEKLNVVVAGIHACSRSDGDKNDPLLAVARAQFHEDHSMHFPNPDATERVGVAGADFFCPNPFTYAQTNPGAKINVCSPCLLPQSIGTLHLDGIGAIWKSDVAKQIRASILDGSFRYCDASQCRALRLGTLPKRGTTATDTLMAECLAAAAEGPTTVALVFGDRGGGEPGDMFSARQSMMENAMAEIPGSVRRVIFGGTAEPLENDYFLTFLREFDPGSRPSLRITLRTNGLALTPALWESLCHASIDTVEVRCDAATPATFALNGSGDFTLLSDNLRALGHECAAGRLEQLCLAFTVQVNNFREMPDFIAFARNSGATCIRFQELQDPGTWAPGEFRRRAVSRPEHPQHLELVSMLRQECFAAPDIDLTDLSDLMHSDNLGENRK